MEAASESKKRKIATDYMPSPVRISNLQKSAGTPESAFTGFCYRTNISSTGAVRTRKAPVLQTRSVVARSSVVWQFATPKDKKYRYANTLRHTLQNEPKTLGRKARSAEYGAKRLGTGPAAPSTAFLFFEIRNAILFPLETAFEDVCRHSQEWRSYITYMMYELI